MGSVRILSPICRSRKGADYALGQHPIADPASYPVVGNVEPGSVDAPPAASVGSRKRAGDRGSLVERIAVGPLPSPRPATGPPADRVESSTHQRSTFRGSRAGASHSTTSSICA